jgi:hypothetical protein
MELEIERDSSLLYIQSVVHKFDSTLPKWVKKLGILPAQYVLVFYDYWTKSDYLLTHH